MSQKYRKKPRRSSRKRTRQPEGEVLGIDDAAVQLSLPIAEILAGAHDAVEAVAGQAGLLVMQAIIDQEVKDLTGGDRHARSKERQAFRWGHENGFVVFAGQKLSLRRPRVRGLDNKEVRLGSYSSFRQDGRMQRATARRVIRGVSTRNYEGVIEAMEDGYGVKKSSVSRHWKASSAQQLAELMERPLGELDLQAIMIDGIEFHGFLLVVALGFTSDGTKHVLGLWQGVTENAQLCRALLRDLADRGLDLDRRYLFVLDGSKALLKGVRAVFGNNAIVQRCQFHKEQNVLSYLPQEYQAMARQRLRAAWGMKDYEKAKKALEQTISYLEDLSPSAASSLREGLEETLTLHRLKAPAVLRRTFRTTNPIESLFGRWRELCQNVKHWKNEDMAKRWAGATLLEAEKHFRRVRGYREMPLLASALNDATVAGKEAAA